MAAAGGVFSHVEVVLPRLVAAAFELGVFVEG